MQQGSLAWLQWRRKKIGASDAPIIMGVSPYSTPYQLWAIKTDRAEGMRGNWATERGHRWEPAARARYELETGLELPPTTMTSKVYDFIAASLDGFGVNPEGKRIVLEIKIPGAEVFNMAKKKKVHPKYVPQLIQQMHVADADEAHFFCCKVEKVNGTEQIVDTALVIVKRDLEAEKELLFHLVTFWEFVRGDVPPPLKPEDTVLLEDQSSVELFSRVKKTKLEIKQIEQAIAKLSDKLTELDEEFKELKEEATEHVENLDEIRHTKFHCIGVTFAKNKKGTWVVTLSSENSDEAQTLKEA